MASSSTTKKEAAASTEKMVGAFQTLYYMLRNDDNKFFNYFRKSVNSFDELLTKLDSSIQRQDTVLRDCIQPIQMLAVTLR